MQRERHTDIPTDIQTHRQTHRHPDRHTDRHTRTHTTCLFGMPSFLIDWFATIGMRWRNSFEHPVTLALNMRMHWLVRYWLVAWIYTPCVLFILFLDDLGCWVIMFCWLVVARSDTHYWQKITAKPFSFFSCSQGNVLNLLSPKSPSNSASFRNPWKGAVPVHRGLWSYTDGEIRSKIMWTAFFLGW